MGDRVSETCRSTLHSFNILHCTHTRKKLLTMQQQILERCSPTQYACKSARALQALFWYNTMLCHREILPRMYTMRHARIHTCGWHTLKRGTWIQYFWVCYVYCYQSPALTLYCKDNVLCVNPTQLVLRTAYIVCHVTCIACATRENSSTGNRSTSGSSTRADLLHRPANCPRFGRCLVLCYTDMFRVVIHQHVPCCDTLTFSVLHCTDMCCDAMHCWNVWGAKLDQAARFLFYFPMYSMRGFHWFEL